MNGMVRIEQAGEIGLLVLNNPPVNALGVMLRTAIQDALNSLLDDARVKAIVLYGEGRFFSAGADIKDFARSGESPTLPDVLKSINDSSKPVIAVLHGVAFGGALELALAAHLRIGITGLKIGLPEVKLGLLPGAGGTQRLSRLTGIAHAINIITTGRDVLGAEAVELNILARIDNGTARDAGIAAAKEVLSDSLAVIPTDELVISADDIALDVARNKFAGKLKAPLLAIDAIEASTLPIEQGLAIERALFMELMQGDEHAGLVHALFAERITSKIPEHNAQPRSVNRIGVIGGGTMGVGIATVILNAGFPLVLIELQNDRIAQARAAIEKNLAGALKRGKLNEKDYAAALTSLECSADLATLSQVDLVIEAIFENMDSKIDLFKKLDTICNPEAILATNTSYLDINQIAAATSRPESVIGLHFFSPAHIMRLLEVVVAEKTAPEVTRTAFDLAAKIRKVPVRAGVCEGFIGNRILTEYRKACEYLLLDGASFEEIDKALESFGFAMGPFAVGDLAGLDISRANRERVASTRPTEERYSRVADQICNNGWFGRKTGQGYYLYEDNQKLGPNPGAIAIVRAERLAAGIELRSFTDEDIIARCLTAMIAESVRVFESGIALRPADIDAVEIFGYGFPRHRGGPMHMADIIGIDTLISRIEAYAREDSYFWRVPQLLRAMAGDGKIFSDFNSA